MESRLPSVVYGGAAVEYVDSAAISSGEAHMCAQVHVVEWDALCDLQDSLKGRPHLVALAPAYREEHLEAVAKLATAGSRVHLLYGDAERRETIRLLRFVVHPRFAMVCTYRAMQQGADGHLEGLAEARRIAWDMQRVALSDSLLVKARQILDQLGVGHTHQGKAKLDARQNPSYQQAVAEYEECVALCETL
jgi:hypothetical protein